MSVLLITLTFILIGSYGVRIAGMDAEVAYAFHSGRQNHPEKFKNQFTNQVDTYFLRP